MLYPRHQLDPTLDPDDLMAGKCLHCGEVARCRRWETRQPKGGLADIEPGTWDDVPSTGCVKCGNKVFVMKAEDFLRCLPPEPPPA